MNISQLKNSLGTGANPSKFKVEIVIPIMLRASGFINTAVSNLPIVGDYMANSGPKSIPDTDIIGILAKATSLPDKSIGTIDVWHRGHKFTVRGAAQFTGRWSVTFYNTPDLNLRQFFEGWMYEIDRYDSVLTSTIFPNDYLGVGSINSGYMTNLKVYQLCSKGVSAGYEFFYAFPIEISSTELGSNLTNTISEFSVTFAYSYWIPHSKDSLIDKMTNIETSPPQVNPRQISQLGSGVPPGAVF